MISRTRTAAAFCLLVSAATAAGVGCSEDQGATPSVGTIERVSVAAATSDASALTAAELSRIDAYWDQHFYSDSEIQYSFHTKFGEQVDCIDFYAQRSVKAFQARGVAISLAGAPTAPPSPP